MKNLAFFLILASAFLFSCTANDTDREPQRTSDSMRLARFIKDSADVAKSKADRTEKQRIIDSVVAATTKKSTEKIVYVRSVKNEPNDKIAPAKTDSQKEEVSEEELAAAVSDLVALMKKKIHIYHSYLPRANGDSIFLWDEYRFKELFFVVYPGGSMFLQVETQKRFHIVDDNANGLRENKDENDEYGHGQFFVKKSDSVKVAARSDYFKTVQSYKKKLEALPDAS